MCDTFDADARNAADDPQSDPVVVGDLGPVHVAGRARLASCVAAPLRALSFIHFARWALIERWPRRSPDAARPRGAALDAVPHELRRLRTSSTSRPSCASCPGASTGSTGARRASRARAASGRSTQYIDEHSHHVDHFWMAYPEASTTMVAPGARAPGAYDARSAAPATSTIARRFASAVAALRSPDGAGAAVSARSSSCWRRCATARPRPPGPRIAALDEPFARVPGTHLARAAGPAAAAAALSRAHAPLRPARRRPRRAGRAVAGRRRARARRRCSPTARSGPAPTTRPRSCAGRGRASCRSASRSSARRTRASRRSARRSRCASASRRSPRETTVLDDAALQAAWRAGDRRRRPPGRDRARLRPALRLRPPSLRPRPRAARRARLPGRARRPGDHRGGVGRAPGHDAQRRALLPRARGAGAAGGDPRRLPGRVSLRHGGSRRAASATTRGTWEDELRDLEVLLVVHAQSAGALAAEAGRWERALRAPASGLELAHAQPAGLLGEQREHFGFTDGFSQPAIEGVAREDVRGQGIPYKRLPWWPLSRTRWRPIKPGEFVLGYEDEDRGPAPAPPAPFDRNATLHGVAQAAPGRRAASAPSSPSRPAPGARRGARRGQARRALARRQPARRCAPTGPTPSWATTSCAPTTSATATTRSACAARAAPTCAGPTRATRWAGRGG